MKKAGLLSLTLAAAVSFTTVGGAGAAQAEGSLDALLKNKALNEVHTFAGSGDYKLMNGASLDSAFREPRSVLYDAQKKSLLIADAGNQLLRTVDKGTVNTAAGAELGTDEYRLPVGALADGASAQSAFHTPSGLARSQDGTVYVADADNHAIRVIGPSGTVKTIAGNGVVGHTDGSAGEATFHYPLDVAVNKDGVVYVADTLNHVIRQIKDGKVTTLNAASQRVVEYAPGGVDTAGDFADGPLGSAKFNEPSGLALDAKGNLYVSDTGNQRIRYIDFASGTVSTVAGGESGKASYGAGALYMEGGFADGSAAGAKFHAPRGIAATPDGGLLIADSLNHAIRYLKDSKVTTVAGIAGEAGRADGLASTSEFNRPVDVEWMGNGSFSVADSGNNTIRVVEPYRVPQGIKAAKNIHLLYGNSVIVSDAPPLTLNNSTFVPVRVLTEKLGFKVGYSSGKTTLTRGTVSYVVQAGSMNVVKSVEGQAAQTIKLAASPVNKGNRLYLPVRFFAEEIGLDVQWLSDVRAVLIRDK
ncbi:copper amine oxidase [Paenibacillus oenotherae]|uniref:Copper amine oxidase n=1 Tax=Paenibacillus oenotherae TaxID=1435645 RepID=A0ABS7DD93_9BACL|nr:stalk domain-containing protein [Paenibacillus oenotherae]MBW7477714.1 copper amine oxidase [Paenibacillus oenotherae]